jgi:uncharacterized protein (TIGR03435 family)
MYRLATGALIIAGLVHAQSFDAASLKPSGDKSVRGSMGGPGSKDPTRYTFGKATPLDLIATAYDVLYFQVTSKLPLDSQFDLTTTIPAGATKDEFRAMLRNLLSERFNLKVHMETKDFPAHELLLAKSGPKLKESPEKPDARRKLTSNMSSGGDGVLIHLEAEQVTMADLVRGIPLPERTQIFDRTGLTGKYDFTIDYTYEIPGRPADGASPSGVPSVYHAFEQELGLRLVPKKMPFQVVVVDAIDKMPVDN